MLRLWSALAAMAASAAAQNAVVTYQYDNSRAGFNPRELALTKSNVTSSQFGKLFSYKVDGYLYAQPVYLPGVRIPGKGLHNVVYAVTEHDSVYAFDADSGGGANSAPLWHVSFLNSAAGVTSVPATDTNCGQIAPEIGITSTPVIDLAAGTIYVVAMTKESSSYIHRLHALDAATGAERPGSPVTIQATFPGTGEGGATVTFNAKNYKQRPGLLLLNGVVYTAWSSHCDIGTYHGWLIGYDAQTLRQVSVYNNTPNGNEGSFWHGGAAPAADAAGNIFVVSGNGTFNTSGSDLGESYIKLSSAGGLTVSDFFTPYNYSSLNNSDLDTGSAGVALLPDEAGSAAHPHLMVGAGKEGRIYLLDRDNLGKWRSGSDNQIVQSIPGAIGGLFGNPAYFGKMVYFCGSGDNLKAFPISGGQMATAPASKSPGSFGFPGCLPTVSANGTSNGIVWILETAGILHAYDAANLATELYNSNQNASRDSLGAYVKFSVPMVVNGKVYAGSQAALNVYGLLGAGGVFSLVNAASGVSTATSAGAIVSLYGATTLPGGQADAYPLPPSLNGVAVTVNGQLAPLYYAGPGQINAQIPVDLPVGTASIVVTANGVTVGTATVAIQAVSPGLFKLAENRAAALNPDYSVNSPAAPASAGSVIAAYLTGLGATDNPVATGAAASSNPPSHVTATVTATVGGQPAEVQFAGLAPGYGGLYQVNVVIPQIAPGDYPLQVSAGGLPSNTALVSVR
jgi:uncharacterized protein (TIGR03437 family)